MNKQQTVLLGLSGGVDSSVAAFLLKKQGYKIIGAFMKNFSDTKDPLTGECNWQSERKMAQKVAIKLDIPFVTLDFEKEYKKLVIEPMLSAYKKGFTPNPDIACNTIIKFPLFYKVAKKLGAEYIATGHYARIKEMSKGYNLLAGKDKTKDQSYFLAGLSQQDLAHTLFPIGNMKKELVRKIAKKIGLPNWDKHGTAGVCFIGNINFQEFLKGKIKKKIGKVIDSNGNTIGNHLGVHYYTIGQKASPHIGINIQKPSELAQERFYIAEKRKNNTLLVVPENHPLLSKKEVIISSLHIINPKDKLKSNITARIRHLGQLHQGKLAKKGNKHIFIFNKPVQSIAEGQYIVLYNKELVVGSGEIRLK